MNREILIPEYLKNFSCIGAKCEDTCCAGWKVTVDKATFQKYRNVKVPGIKDELKKNVTRERSNPSDAAYGKIKMDEKNACTLLTEEGWCKIHAELGEEFLCNTCTVYPRNLNQVDQRVEKSLTPSCPEAARLMLLKKEGMDFIIDEEDTKKKGDIYKEIDTSKMPYFWDLRMFSIGILQNRSQSLEVRLMTLGLFYQKLVTFSLGDMASQLENSMQQYERYLSDDKQVKMLMDLPQNRSFQMNMAKELVRYRLSGGITSQRYIDCLKEMLDGLKLEDDTEIDASLETYERNYVDYYQPFMKEHEYVLENYAVNYVFKNLFPYDQPNFFESYVMLVVNLSLIKLHLIGMAGHHKGLTTDLVIKLVQSYSKTVEHNVSYLTNVREMLRESGYTTMAHMVVLIKS